MGTVDSGYVGITAIQTGGVLQHEQTLRKTQIPVQVRAEIFSANPEEVPVKLSNWELSTASARPPFPNSISIHSFSCPFSLSWLFPHRLKEMVPAIAMLKECCSIPRQPRAELWSKQRGKSSTSRGVRGGCFGGSDERGMPWCKLQFGSQCGRRRRRYKASDGWRTVFGKSLGDPPRKIWI